MPTFKIMDKRNVKYPIVKLKVMHSLLLLSSIVHVTQATAADALIGAVVNYKPRWEPNKPLHDNIMANAESYCELIKQASTSSADLIVFPAEGLRGANLLIQQLASSPTDINQLYISNNEAVKLVSRCANNARIYVVMTVDQLVNNRTCLAQLVLERNGTIIARNLEVGCRDDGENADEMFTIDKGYKMGLLLNEDIYLNERTEKLRNLQVRHFALSYDLVESRPFASGIQTEWWWSYGEECVLLASGLDEPQKSGSGIYLARLPGVIASVTLSYHHVNRLIVQKLPKITSKDGDYLDESKVELADGMRKLRRSFGSSAIAYAESCASIDKRALKEEVGDNLDNYTRSLITVNYLNKIHDIQTVIMDETECNSALCCRFKLTWIVGITEPKKHEDRKESTEAEFGHRGPAGCYLLVVGNQKEILGGRGVAHVNRCALVYTTTSKYCTNNKPSLASFIHQQMLDPSNSILKHLEIMANQPQLTPNILLAKRYEPLIDANNLIYKGEPLSRLYITRAFRRFITYGLQSVHNYTLN